MTPVLEIMSVFSEYHPSPSSVFIFFKPTLALIFCLISVLNYKTVSLVHTWTIITQVCSICYICKKKKLWSCWSWNVKIVKWKMKTEKSSVLWFCSGGTLRKHHNKKAVIFLLAKSHLKCKHRVLAGQRMLTVLSRAEPSRADPLVWHGQTQNASLH